MIHVNIERPRSLTGYSGFYTSSFEGAMIPTIDSKGTVQEKVAFRRACGIVVANINALEEIDCEAAVRCLVNKDSYTMDGRISVWGHTLVPIARDLVNEIRNACDGARAICGDSSFTVNYNLTRVVKKRA